MSIFLKDLDDITEADIRVLIENQVSENRQLEYKRDLPGNTDSEKKEFLADISSFSNASGGNIIYGLEEKDGIPKSIKGITSSNVDQDIARLNSIIQSGLSPRIPGLRMKVLSFTGVNNLLIIRIPRSWVLPHMVSFQNYSRFYSRNINGKYPLEIQEIKSLFIASQNIVEKVRNFRAERIGNIIAEETPIPVEKGAKIVLHIIPLNAFELERVFDLSIVQNWPQPIYTNGWSGRYNFDGYFTFSTIRKETIADTYVQFFRNGIVEAVETFLLSGENKIIPSIEYELELLRRTTDYLKTLRELSVEPPIIIMLSLIGVKGYAMSAEGYWRPDRTPTIEKDVLTIEPVVMEKYEDDLQIIFKPIFDSVWNAAGWPRDENYKEGKWVGQRGR